MQRLAVIVLLVACSSESAKRPADIVVLDKAPADAIRLDVIARELSCVVTYPNGGVSENQLTIPAGRAVSLHIHTDVSGDSKVGIVGTRVVKLVRMREPKDLHVRIDTVGSRRWLCPRVTSTVQSSEELLRVLNVVSPADYEAYLASVEPNLPANLIVRGKELYQTKGCNACHTIDGSPKVGPSWKGIWGKPVEGIDGVTTVVNWAFVDESIRQPTLFTAKGFPPGIMPSFDGQLTPQQVREIAAFIESLAD